MRFYKTFFILASILALPTICYSQDSYLVILESFKRPTIQQGRLIKKQFAHLTEKGFSPYFIKTDDYPPLRKGLWAMVLGEFNEKLAKTKQQMVKKILSESHVRKVNLPTVKAIDENFSYSNTYVDNDHCFTIQDVTTSKEGGSAHSYCVGKHGMHIDKGYVEVRSILNIAGQEIYGNSNTMGMSMPEISSKYPISWIYQSGNLQRPIAVSMVVEDMSKELNGGARYLFILQGRKFALVKQKFPVKGLNKIAHYLQSNY